MCEERQDAIILSAYDGCGFSGEPTVVPVDFMEPIFPPLRAQIKKLFKKTSAKALQKG